MKIAIVAGPYIPVPPFKYGGTERVIFYLIKGLLAAGHQPVLLGPGDSAVDCEVIPIVPKALYFPKTTKQVPQFKTLLKQAQAETHKQLEKLLPHIDIIHSHDFDLLKFKNFPNITTIHGPIEFVDLEYFETRKALNYVSISKNQQDGYPDLNWVGVVYNGEDPALFPVVKRPENYVCFVGRFDQQKNPHLAIKLAIEHGLKIKLAGKIDFQGDEYFKQEIKPYLKHPLVEYLGEVDAQTTTKLLSRAKLNLHPTGFREPFGLTVLEAAYCGTPTLAIARGSMPELIQEGMTGMLVEDFVEGYHHVEECFKMNREYIARRARLLFNYQNMTKDYVRVYEKVLKHNTY